MIQVGQVLERSQIDGLVLGRVRFFDPVRRWGFITPDDGGGDVWLRFDVLQANGVPEKALLPGVRVRFAQRPSELSGRRPVVTVIKLVEV